MSYRQDPRNQYYNNGTDNQSGYAAGGYQQGQLYSNPRTQNDGYRSPVRNPYSAPNPNIKGIYLFFYLYMYYIEIGC